MHWRKQHKIDSILDEQYEYEKYFPFDLFEDNDGRPGISYLFVNIISD